MTTTPRLTGPQLRVLRAVAEQYDGQCWDCAGQKGLNSKVLRNLVNQGMLAYRGSIVLVITDQGRMTLKEQPET